MCEVCAVGCRCALGGDFGDVLYVRVLVGVRARGGLCGGVRCLGGV